MPKPPKAEKPPIPTPEPPKIIKPKRKPGFQKGFDPKRTGNRRGRPNLITRDLKQGIIDGAVKHGSNGKGSGGLVGYCYFLAKKHPNAFAGLLAKLVPLQVNGSIGQHIEQVNIVSVPADRYLSAEDIAKLAAPALDAEAFNVVDVEPIAAADVDADAADAADAAAEAAPLRDAAE